VLHDNKWVLASSIRHTQARDDNDLCGS